MAGKSKEQKAAERADIATIQSQFHLNIDDAIANIATVVNGGSVRNDPSNAPSGLYDPNVLRQERQLREGIVAPKGPMAEHINWDQFGMKVAPGSFKKVASATNNPVAAANLQQMLGNNQAGYAPSYQNNTLKLSLQNRIADRFSPILNELSKFKFAASDEKRQEQMQEIVGGLKVAMKKLALKDVVTNTKTLYDNADNFYQTSKGIRVVFKVAKGNSKVSVTAEGDFCGDEIICLEEEGANVTAYIARQGEDGFEDLTGNYVMKMEMA